MSEGSTALREPALRARALEVLFFPSVNWLALQDPGARFTAARPRLPGQRFPGLGLGKRVYEGLIGWASA